MRADPHPRRAPFRAVALLACLPVLLAACTQPVEPPRPQPATQSPSASPTPRMFTLVTTGPVTTADPAVATGYTDSMIVNSVYQRLMVVLPDTGELKPDAATDCLFTSKLVYECTLPDTLSFHNGHVLDASDVKFSIQRALRLDVADTSIGLLSALKRIVTPNAHTVEFELSYPDNQFGYALAGQAASIVDEEAFNPDTPLPLETLPIGSGPYEVQTIAGSEVTVSKFDKYVGPKAGLLDALKVQIVADSVAAEAAINEGTADAVWRSLDNAALQRVSDEIDGSADNTTAMGFRRFPLAGMRVTQLIWNENSKLRDNAKLREGVEKALQPDRTLDSIVPVGVPDHAKSFTLGGRPKLPDLNGTRIHMTLGYVPTAPGQADLASLIRDRIESLGGVSVRLVTSGGADLWLTDSPAWVNNAMGWLQRYLERPLAGSTSKLELLETRARTTNGTARTAALTELQQQAVADATVLPVSQGNGILFLAKGVDLVGEPFGSGQMLGLWGFTRA